MGDAPRDPAIAELPPVLATIAEAIGLAPALKLAATWGGVQISVPARVGPNHPLAKLIGMEATRALRRLIVDRGLGDSLCRIEIPRAHAAGARGRRRRIKEAVDAGMSKRQAALAFGLTNRHVRRVCNERPADPRQGKLL